MYGISRRGHYTRDWPPAWGLLRALTAHRLKRELASLSVAHDGRWALASMVMCRYDVQNARNLLPR
jgi:hypothetical protein